MATKLFDIDVCLPELWRLIKLQLDTKQGKLVAGTGIAIEDDGTISVTLDTTLFKFVTTLPDKPDEGDENKIFIVKSAQGETGNEYTEYYWTGSEWEKLGEFKADVDLSDYYTKEEVDSKISEVNSTIESTKSELESSISDTANTAQSNLESAISELDEKIESVEASDKYYPGDGIDISEENVISAVYDIATVEEIDEICK